MKLFRTNVLIDAGDLDSSEKTTASGLIITKKPASDDRGVVVDFGDACTSVEKGQTVVFRPHSMDKVEIDGKKYLVVEEVDILLSL